MKLSVFRLIAMLSAVLMLPTGNAISGQPTKLFEDEARDLGIEAYIYGYPLVTMEMTRRVMTNVSRPWGPQAPMGQFASLHRYPDASSKDVTMPNTDTLYSTAFLDLTKEPYVLSLPDMRDRYFLMPMFSAWSEVFQVPGKRTTGTGPQTYVITGPGWKGALPQGIQEYKSPTNLVWIVGRTYSSGSSEDLKAVRDLQDEYKLTPLSAYGKPYTPPAGKVDAAIDMKTPVRDQVNRMSVEKFFSMLAQLIKDNPPASADAPMMAKLKRLGVEPGRTFDVSKADSAVRMALMGVPVAAAHKMMTTRKSVPTLNGWLFSTNSGVYGTRYLHRATMTFFAPGANRPQDAIHAVSEMDANGEPYDGANQYVIHFAPDEMPPVQAFWSITMYTAERVFVTNPLNRYTLSQRDKLKQNPDRSVDLYLQKDSPGPDKESNWLPAPPRRFTLMLRMYWPAEGSPSVLNGTWRPPVVKQTQMTSVTH